MANTKSDILHCRVIGEGHPVVFLHGFMLSNVLWESMLTKAPKGYKLILPDLPGHGLSTHVSCPKEINGIARRVEQTLETLSIKEYSIVGHSLGGYVALALMKQGASIQKTVLLNSNFWADPPDKQIERNRICKVVKLNANYFIQEAIPHLFPPSSIARHQTVIEKLIKSAQKMDPEDIVSATIAMRDRPDLSDVFLQNRLSVLIIHGARDHIVQRERMYEHLKENRVGADTIYESDSGHMTIIEDTPKTTAAIFDFLS